MSSHDWSDSGVDWRDATRDPYLAADWLVNNRSWQLDLASSRE